MVFYLFVFVLLILIFKGYFVIANRYNIIDRPNERSSHTRLTIRGGGIVFPLAALVWFLIYGFGEPWIIFAMLLMSTISFIDDIIALSSGIRILAHFTAVSILFWQLQVFGLPIYIIIFAFLVAIGWINAFNFMDGINGITAFYSLVTLSSFAWINFSVGFIPNQLIIVLVLSVVIFSFYNARTNAIVFAGDVGSVTMAFLLLWFMTSLMIKTGRIEYILFFAIYGIDTVITIFFRVLRSENVFKAHRTHLYQYLSNELKWPQILVSFIYGFLQLLINIVAIILIEQNMMTVPVFIFFLMILSFGYIIVRYRVAKSIQY
jgi:UDP-N-acetylmuramyl pentapeptide phosphotransferase/UDP-N-acetylglucosamine-1-phosphate transferase